MEKGRLIEAWREKARGIERAIMRGEREEVNERREYGK
jgi:hypothetical protein